MKAKDVEKSKASQRKHRAHRATVSAKHLGPSLSALSPDLRTQIAGEFQKIYEGAPDIPLRQIHLLLAQRFRLPKSIVAQTIKEERDRIPMPEEIRGQIVQRYVAYVNRMERPERGRRRTIARELQIPFKKVAKAVREWKDQQPKISEVPRNARFHIEKSYIQYLSQGKGLEEIGQQLSQQTGFTPWQVHRYLDLIHNGEKLLRKVPDVSTNERRRIEEGYRAYIQAPVPPGSSLHDVLAQEVGVHYKQVHRVLLDHRLKLRRNHLGY